MQILFFLDFKVLQTIKCSSMSNWCVAAGCSSHGDGFAEFIVAGSDGFLRIYSTSSKFPIIVPGTLGYFVLRNLYVGGG